MILGGVGLGICSACGAPGAFWYPCDDAAWNRYADATGGWWPGVWMCDSCQWLSSAAARVRADVERIRAAHADAEP